MMTDYSQVCVGAVYSWCWAVHCRVVTELSLVAVVVVRQRKFALVPKLIAVAGVEYRVGPWVQRDKGGGDAQWLVVLAGEGD
jgi:hypothetical protein